MLLKYYIIYRPSAEFEAFVSGQPLWQVLFKELLGHDNDLLVAESLWDPGEEPVNCSHLTLHCQHLRLTTQNYLQAVQNCIKFDISAPSSTP